MEDLTVKGVSYALANSADEIRLDDGVIYRNGESLVMVSMRKERNIAACDMCALRVARDGIGCPLGAHGYTHPYRTVDSGEYAAVWRPLSEQWTAIKT